MKKKDTELKETRSKLQKDIQTLSKNKHELEEAAVHAENYYSQTVVNAAVLLTHLNKLEKTAGQFNKTVQMMNAGYFLQSMRNTVEEVRNPADPADVKIRSIWTPEDKNFFDKSMLDLSQRIYKAVTNE